MAKKYRPYLTLQNLKDISYQLKLTGAVNHRGLVIYLDTYISQIEAGLREENYTSAPTIAQKLGFEEETDSTRKNTVSPETLFAAWQANASLTVAELDVVNQYRYENDLMTPQEETAYEKSLGLSN